MEILGRVRDQGDEDDRLLVADCPVRTGRADILATAYVKEGATLVAVASWAEAPARVPLIIDGRRSASTPKARMEAPGISEFQKEKSLTPETSRSSSSPAAAASSSSTRSDWIIRGNWGTHHLIPKKLLFWDTLTLSPRSDA